MLAEEYRPPAGHPLHPYVMAIFRLRARAAPHRETILPKGDVHVLFNLGDAVHVQGDQLGPDGVRWTDTYVAGLATRPYVTRPLGDADYVGISLHAETCAPILRLPLYEITDAVIDGPLVLPELRALGDRLRAASDFAAQCALLLAWLHGRLRPTTSAAAVRHACTLLRTSCTEDGVWRTARELTVSPRHLRRLFADHVGVSPAQYARLARFVDALHLLGASRQCAGSGAPPRRTLTEVACTARYYDQAHFCRDFRAFAGMTPQAYRQSTVPTVGLIYSR